MTVNFRKHHQKFCHTVECIGALPLPMRVKCFLTGAKALPAITYGAHISRIPKQSLQKMHTAVAKALWQGRPMARSKWLVNCFTVGPTGLTLNSHRPTAASLIWSGTVNTVPQPWVDSAPCGAPGTTTNTRFFASLCWHVRLSG